MRPTRQSPLILLLCLALLAPGCSTTYVFRGPRTFPERGHVECTTEQTWPVIDAVIGGIYGLSAIGIATGAIQPTRDESTPPAVAAVASLLFGAAFGFSSYWGFKETAHCAKGRAALLARERDGQEEEER